MRRTSIGDASPIRRPRAKKLTAIGALIAAWLVLAAPNDIPHDAFLTSFEVFFGNLHSHTTLSDGSGSPAAAFAHARSTAKLDFLAVTEHNHTEADNPKEPPVFGAGIAVNHALYSELTSAATNANDNGTFVTLFGQEFSNIKDGNHMNVIGASRVIDEHDDAANGDFKALYGTYLPNDAGVKFVQMNHPWLGPHPKETNYGLAQYGTSYKRLKEASLPWLRTIEVISGPALRHETGLPATVQGEPAYIRYLTRGFRLAPTADQDNHYKNWGTLTDARTGVLATSLSRTAILQGIDQRRVYASTDKNLRVWFGVDGAVMGSDVDAEDRDLNVVWRIEDADEPSATYRVVAVMGRETVPEVKQQVTLATGAGQGAASATLHTTFQRLFVYLKVVQWPNDATKDTVITSPVWITVN
jgi:hypothetical protein